MKKKSELLKLSASSIKLYEQCHRKYYYQYIEKVEVPDKTWGHLELGNFVHAVLEKFHTDVKEQPAEEWSRAMLDICQELKSNYKLTKENVQSSHGMLKTYLDFLKQNGMPPVLANEQGFTINIEDEAIAVRGYIDRIDKNETGDYHIVDYKTGKSKYLDEFQLIVYGLYLLSIHPDLEKFKGSYLALAEGSKFISYVFTKTDLDRGLNKIKKVASDIRSDQTWDPKPTFLCTYCDFQNICPAMVEKRNTGWSIKISTVNEAV